MTVQPASLMRWTTIACFAGAFVLLLIALPVDILLESLTSRIEGLGFWAPLTFAITYCVAATLFIPASALSLAAGVLFGVWVGTAAVWTGAVGSIALSFLIARYALRARVQALADSKPRFGAVDRAVGEQGWRIVALMRLSPVFPFTLQNYLFGVSAIRFWPCWIASAIFITPGTFLYVYLGFVGGTTASAVGGGGANALRLGLQIAGLAATVVVTLVIARVATKAISKHVPSAEQPPSTTVATDTCRRAVSRKAALVFALSVACLMAGATAFAKRDAIRDHYTSLGMRSPISGTDEGRLQHGIPTGSHLGPALASVSAVAPPAEPFPLPRGASRQPSRI